MKNYNTHNDSADLPAEDRARQKSTSRYA